MQNDFIITLREIKMVPQLIEDAELLLDVGHKLLDLVAFGVWSSGFGVWGLGCKVCWFGV